MLRGGTVPEGDLDLDALGRDEVGRGLRVGRGEAKRVDK
jgi:hypothetical protein